MAENKRSERAHASESAHSVKLVSESKFKGLLSGILGTSKKKSDKQLAKFQASNKAKREKRTKQ